MFEAEYPESVWDERCTASNLQVSYTVIRDPTSTSQHKILALREVHTMLGHR